MAKLLYTILVYDDLTAKVIPATVERGWLGMNPNNLRDFDPQQVYSDAVRTARIDVNGVPIKLPAGELWPTGQVRIWLARDIKGIGGEWRIDVKGGKVTGLPPVLQVAEGTAHVFLDCTITEPPLYIRVFRPGCNSSSLFNPKFAELLKSFTGPIRFMDWLGINSSPVVNWEDQPGPNSLTFNGPDESPSRGCYSHAIALCNELGKDCWLNIPHQATADFTIRLARLVKRELNPDLRVFLEYTNEHWNTAGGFDQSHWLFAEAQIQAENDPLLKAGAENQWDIWHRWFAQVTSHLGNLFKSESAHKVTTVLGTHGEEPYYTDRMLGYLKSRSWLDRVDAIAIAPYMGDDPNYHYTSVDDYFEHPTFGILNRTTASWDERGKKHRVIADKYGKKLLFYEFGIGVNKNNTIAQQAQNDPRMGDVVRRYLSHVPDDIMACWFNLATPWQSNPWGLTDRLTDKPDKYWAATIAAGR